MAKCEHKETDLTTSEVATILDKNYRTILRWIKENKFPNSFVCPKCGRNLIPSSDVETYIQNSRIGV